MPSELKNIINNIIAAGSGLIIGISFIIGMEVLEATIYSSQFHGADINSIPNDYFLNSPMWFKVFELLIWALGCLIGSFVAAIISNKNSSSQPLLVGILLFTTSMIFMELYQHPFWFWLGSILAFLPISILGGFLGNQAFKR